MSCFRSLLGLTLVSIGLSGWANAVKDPVRFHAPRHGVMLPARTPVEEDFKILQDWGVTLARYQMCADGVPNSASADLPCYRQWLGEKLDHLEREILPWARKYGLQIVVDMHFPPGGRRGGGDDAFRMFSDDLFAQEFVSCWEAIARRFRGNHDVIYGYDLMNEPVQLHEERYSWQNLQERAALAIRKIDVETPIVFETNMWDGPSTFIGLEPFPVSNAIYEVHMYKPTAYTHQGIGHRASLIGRYPDSRKGWDKHYLRAALRPVRAFEEKYGARIYVGEFSSVSWAEGADVWMRDCMDIFAEYGWDWTYHAFREWPGWSVEHDPHRRAETSESNFDLSPDNLRKRALLAGLGQLRRGGGDNSDLLQELTIGAVNCGAFGYPPAGGADGSAVAREWWRLTAESGADLFLFSDIGKNCYSEFLGNIRRDGLDISLRTGLNVKSVEVVRLPDAGQSNGRGYRTKRCRALRTVIDFAGSEMAVYGVHLVAEGHIPPEKKMRKGMQTPSQKLRQEQFKALIADAARYDYAVIAGDFNAQEPVEYECFTKRGWSVANCSARFGTQATLRKIPADNVIVSPHLKITAFEVPKEYRLDTDHFPVVARVGVRDTSLPTTSEFMSLPRKERVRLFAGRRFRARMLREDYPAGDGLLSRWIQVDGIQNLRDVGGIVNQDGVELKRGVYYRSARWNETAYTPKDKPVSAWKPGASCLSARGCRELVPLNIRTDLDLRTGRECWGQQASPLGTGVSWVTNSFGHYDEIDQTEEFRDAVKLAFSVLADPARRPVVFHCIGGADRTGTLAFLVQGLCGVDEETLVRDWELTGCYTARLDLIHADCIDRLLASIARQPGDTTQAKIESLLRTCGVTESELESVREALLGKAVR